MSDKKPILVTGSPRSGSTWVGNMIAKCPTVTYISEPFRPNHRLGLCGAKFDHAFAYIYPGHEYENYYAKHFNKTLNFSYNFVGGLQSIKNWRDVRACAGEWKQFWRSRRQNARPLLKDPVAVFSAEWLAQRFDMQVVVLIRHPAAYVASRKKTGWRFSFTNLLKEPRLIEEYLYPFKDEIRDYAENEHSLWEESILEWKLIYFVIAQYQKQHKDWIFIRHEDISKSPIEGFKNLYVTLGLDWTESIKKQITEYSYASKKKDQKTGLQEIKRNSYENIYKWKNILEEQEINMIKRKTTDIANIFYDNEKDW